MKKMLYGILAVIVLAILVLTMLSCASNTPKTGLVDGALRSCPNSPNCVSSEVEGSKSYVKPLAFDDPAEAAWGRLKEALIDMGGQIEEEGEVYLRATFRSRLFRFVDDLECRLDPDNKVIQVRSASRVGHSDLGVNRKRVERLREGFQVVEP